MRFTKPISREVDIDGNTFVVSFSDEGIEFRIKGKRRTAQVEWVRVLDIASGDQGEGAREFLGVGEGQGGSNRSGQPSANTASSDSRESGETDQEMGRAVTASDVGRE